MKIDLFLLPFRLSREYWGLRPSACANFPDDITAREVPHGNLLVLFFARPWKSKRRILCLHWSTELYGSKYLLKSVFLLFTNILGLVLLKSFASLKVVWIIHNRYAHDYPHPLMDRFGRRLAATFADVLVAQQHETHEEFRALFPHKQIEYIPHTNFVGAYGPRAKDTGILRKEFGLAADDIVLLSFGSVRPYKKIEQVIDAIGALTPAARERIALVLAGKGSEGYIYELKARAEEIVRLYSRDGYVQDEEVPAVLAAASYSIFYFDESERTSGSLLVSLSYGLPAIARAIPGAEFVDGTNGYTFTDQEGLVAILATLADTARPAPEAVISSLDSFDARMVEKAYHELYERLA